MVDAIFTPPVQLHKAVLVGRLHNTAQARTSYQMSGVHRSPIDKMVRSAEQIMILASQNDMVAALRPFWNRSIPIWEGHTRDALALLVEVLRVSTGHPVPLAEGLIAFVNSVAVGFTKVLSDRLLHETTAGAVRSTKGVPANIQAIARCLLSEPTHKGIADALAFIQALVENKAAGFDGVKIDQRTEFMDAIRMRQFSDADEAFRELARKRSYAHPSPPKRVLSNIHKAKGLECDNVLLMACDKGQFSTTAYARCKMYVALSRAKKSLCLVIPDSNPSPLLKLN